MMMLNISGKPLDDNMLLVISKIPSKDVYLPIECIEDMYIEYMKSVGYELTKLLFNKQYLETIALHELLCEIKDILDDINTIKNFQDIYHQAYKILEEELLRCS